MFALLYQKAMKIMINKLKNETFTFGYFCKSALWYSLLIFLSQILLYIFSEQITIFLLPISFFYNRIVCDRMAHPSFVFTLGFIYDIISHAPYGFHAALFLIGFYVYCFLLGSFNMQKNIIAFVGFGSIFVVWLYFVKYMLVIIFTMFTFSLSGVIWGLVFNLLLLPCVYLIQPYFVFRKANR